MALPAHLDAGLGLTTEAARRSIVAPTSGAYEPDPTGAITSSALPACLAAGLGLALVVVVLLARSRRRLVRLLAAEQAKSNARELAAKLALQERLALDVAAIVAPLRSVLEEQSHARAALAANVASLRALVEWFASFTYAQYAQARASAERTQETVRRPERAVPSLALPAGSAEGLSPEPAQVAAGLGPRPMARPLPAYATPHPRPVRVGAPLSSAPPDSGDSGDWIPQPATAATVVAPPRRPALATSPTLPSMVAPKADDSTGGDA